MIHVKVLSYLVFPEMMRDILDGTHPDHLLDQRSWRLPKIGHQRGEGYMTRRTGARA